MNITLTDTQLAGLAYGTACRNSGNPDAKPMTDEEFAADLLGVQCDRLAADKLESTKQALAANERLMSLGVAVAAQPDKIDEVESAVTAILSKS